jgi:hypothetical protein
VSSKLLALVIVGALGALAYFKLGSRDCENCDTNAGLEEIASTDTQAALTSQTPAATQAIPSTEPDAAGETSQQAALEGSAAPLVADADSTPETTPTAVLNDEAASASATPTKAKTVVVPSKKFTVAPKRGRVRSCLRNSASWFIGGRYARDYVWRINNKDADDSFLMLRTKVEQPKGPIILSHCAPFDTQTGSKLLFTTNIKLTDAGDGSYAFIRAVDESFVDLGAMQTHFSGTQDWQDVRVEFTVPENASDVVFGLQLNAQGTLRVRSAELSAQ